MISSSALPETGIPFELLGKSRDHRRLLVMDRKSGKIMSDVFRNIGNYMGRGDLIVANNSSVVNGALSACYPETGECGLLHVGNSWSDGLRLVEPRPADINRKCHEGMEITLPGTRGKAVLVKRHSDFNRYWWARFSLDSDKILDEYGRKIRYGHVPFDIPDGYYNTVFSSVPGSLEPPSAAFPFTGSIMSSLEKRGIKVALVTLHCNLGSLEASEIRGKDKLLSEYYRVPAQTLCMIDSTRKGGGRIISTGTTVVRALESAWMELVGKGRYRSFTEAAEEKGFKALESHTDLFIREGYDLKVVDSVITGMHDYNSSHIDMMRAFTGSGMLDAAYMAAADNGYLWHEFGDSTIII